VVSLGIGALIARAADKGVIFLVCGVSLALAAIAWRSVSVDGPPVAQAAGTEPSGGAPHHH
jgi:hypothetical protein